MSSNVAQRLVFTRPCCYYPVSDASWRRVRLVRVRWLLAASRVVLCCTVHALRGASSKTRRHQRQRLGEPTRRRSDDADVVCRTSPQRARCGDARPLGARTMKAPPSATRQRRRRRQRISFTSDDDERQRTNTRRRRGVHCAGRSAARRGALTAAPGRVSLIYYRLVFLQRLDAFNPAAAAREWGGTERSSRLAAHYISVNYRTRRPSTSTEHRIKSILVSRRRVDKRRPYAWLAFFSCTQYRLHGARPPQFYYRRHRHHLPQSTPTFDSSKPYPVTCIPRSNRSEIFFSHLR